jgi:hypothetical protein
MQGYSGVFDLVRVDAHVLDRVYAHDAALVDDVDRLAEGIETMNLKTETGDTIVPALLERIDAIEEAWNAREEILKGMA